MSGIEKVLRKLRLYSAAAFVAVMISGCGGGGITTPIPVPTMEQLQAEYRVAIVDAQTAEPNEISRNLVAINAYNNEIIWSGTAGTSNVLVVTWTSWNGYATGAWNMGNYNAWVTVAPEAREFCGSLSGDYVLRVEQLLGLPPKNGKNYFVEIWVAPDDLFRPSPDPEITDHEAELDFPYHVDESHKAWINNLKETMYGENGYPWTRLGYTYDWGNPSGEIGLSEFVIRKNADVEIKGIYSNSAYCNK